MTTENTNKDKIDQLLKEGKNISEIAEELHIGREEVLAAIDVIVSEPKHEDKPTESEAKEETQATPIDEDKPETDETPTEDPNEAIVNESKEAMKNAAKIMGDAANAAGAKIVDFGDKAYTATKDILTDKAKQAELKSKAGDALKKASVQFDKGTTAAADAINDAFNSAKAKSQEIKSNVETHRMNNDPTSNTNDGFDLDAFGRQVGETTGRVINGFGSVFGSLKKSFLDGYNGKNDEHE